MLPEATIHLNGKKSYDFDIQANQLSDILCRGATVSSVQSTNNTLTRNSTLRDTGDYDVPHPHPYTHHYMTTSTSATPQAMSIHGSSPQGACPPPSNTCILTYSFSLHYVSVSACVCHEILKSSKFGFTAVKGVNFCLFGINFTRK